MSEHDDMGTDHGGRLTVPVTPQCSSRSSIVNGRPVLVIDYGGYELAFEAVELGESSEFAVGLAFAALCFSSRCRRLSGARHG